MVKEYFSYLFPFLLITWIGFVCIRFGGLQKDRRRTFLFMIPVVSAPLTFVPIRGLSLAQYLLSFNPVYSIGTTTLFFIQLIGYASEKKLLSARDMTWFALWNIAISLPLYASSLGLLGADLYRYGYGFSIVFVVTAIVAVMLLMVGNRLSYILISSLAAFDFKVLFSNNFFDYLTDGVLFVISLGILVYYGSRRPFSFFRKYEIEDKYVALFFAALLLLIPLRLLYIHYGLLDLIPDEAHYWEWSRRLDLSYYSKGPVIAYLIALSTHIEGNTVGAVRFFAPFLLSLSSLLLYLLSVEMFNNKRAGILSGVLLQIVPLFAAFGIIMTIDSPFVFFWCLGLWSMWKALKSHRPDFWHATGIIVGLGFLAKYTMLFFPFCALLFLLFSKDDRHWLRTIHPYASLLLSLLVSSPVLIWNARHGWVTVLHTAGRAGIYKGFRALPTSLLEFVGSQIGILTPLLTLLGIYVLVKYRKAFHGLLREKRFLLSFSLPVLVFFLLKSIQGKVEANWAMVSYPSLMVLFSYYLVNVWRDFGTVMKYVTVGSLVLASTLTSVIHFSPVLHLPPRIDPTYRLSGWKHVGDIVSRFADEMSAGGPLFVFADNYDVASELAFYVEGNPATYCANLGRRMNQYDLWPGFETFRGYNALFVKRGDFDVPDVLASAFDRHERYVFDVDLYHGRTGKFTFVKFYGFKGGLIKEPTTF